MIFASDIYSNTIASTGGLVVCAENMSNILLAPAGSPRLSKSPISQMGFLANSLPAYTGLETRKLNQR